jgi:hypothetical protein
MAVKVENGLRTWLIRIGTTITFAWAGWATAEIIDIKEKSAYTIGHGEEFETRVTNELVRISDTLKDIETKLDRWILGSR